MSDKQTQTSAIKKYLEEGNTITSMEAFERFGCTRLSAKIFDLRKLGMEIDSVPCTGTTRFGTECRYVMYRLHNNGTKKED